MVRVTPRRSTLWLALVAFAFFFWLLPGGPQKFPEAVSVNDNHQMFPDTVPVIGDYQKLPEKFPETVPVNGDYHVLKRREDERHIWSYQVANFSLGTPPRSFEAVLSLQSTDIFVPNDGILLSSVCPDCIGYVPSASGTYRPGKKGGMHRTETIDTLTVAGGIQVPNQPFLLDLGFSYNVEEKLPGHQYSGFGLAVGPPRKTHQDKPYRIGEIQTVLSPFRNMIDSKVLDRNMFSLRLARNLTDEGHIMFGGYDNNQFEGDLVNHPWYMPETSFWSIEVSSVLMTTTNAEGLKNVLVDESLAGVQVTLTTGPQIQFPDRFLTKILAALNTTADDCLSNDCLDCDSDLDKLPVMSFLIGDQKFDITPSEYVIKYKYPSWHKERCDPLFGRVYNRGGNSDGDQIYLGTPFLDKVYSVYDWDEKTISCKWLFIF